MQYFVILTLVLGARQVTSKGVLTVGPAITKAGIYDHTIEQIVASNGDQWREATTVFFSAEPNTLG